MSNKRTWTVKACLFSDEPDRTPDPENIPDVVWTGHAATASQAMESALGFGITGVSSSLDWLTGTREVQYVDVDETAALRALQERFHPDFVFVSPSGSAHGSWDDDDEESLAMVSLSLRIETAESETPDGEGWGVLCVEVISDDYSDMMDALMDVRMKQWFAMEREEERKRRDR